MADNFKKYYNSAGFTLIELIIAMAIFGLVILITADIFLSGFGSTERIFGSQAIQENGRFILESMSKEIRMSEIDGLDGLAIASLPDGFSGPYYSLNITNADSEDVTYFFDNANKRISKNGLVLSASNIEVSGRFYLTKNSVFQPRLTISFSLVNQADQARSQAAINLQTTVSSREYAR